MKCMDCPMLRIEQEPRTEHDGLWLICGTATCEYCKLRVDFWNYDRLNELECVLNTSKWEDVMAGTGVCKVLL